MKQIYDDVNGHIIGGDTCVRWRVLYEDRPQGEGYSESDAQAEADARAKIDALITQFGGFPTYCYQDKSKWEIRIYQ